MLHPYWDLGFMVDVTWFPLGTNVDSGEKNDANAEDSVKVMKPLFPDAPNLHWLVNYTRARAGELNSGEVTFMLYNSDDFENSNPIETHIWNKNKESENYIPGWKERIDEFGAVVIKNGPWQIALSTNPKMEVTSIVQGAPIDARFKHSISIQIQDYKVSVSVPVSIKYQSEEYPAYTDQTKVNVRFPYAAVNNAFEKSGDIYKYFYREAEKSYMAQVIKDSDSSMFWPALGEPDELIIAEGYSAITALKAQRDPMTQACIALRGKILNCWNLEMQKAMLADVVKQILNAVIYTNYKRVIIATDEDADGSHICGLLISASRKRASSSTL